MSSKAERVNAAPSIVSADVRLKGNLVTSGEVQFDGSIDGDLRCGALIVGQSAHVNGSVIAENVIVHGTVTGTIRATSVRFEKSSKLVGDVWHKEIAIAAGAHIEGHIVHSENPMEDAKRGMTPNKGIEPPKGDIKLAIDESKKASA